MNNEISFLPYQQPQTQHNHEKSLKNIKFKVIKTITECNLWKFLCHEKRKQTNKTHTKGNFLQTEIDKRRNCKCKAWFWIILNLTPLWLRVRWSLSAKPSLGDDAYMCSLQELQCAFLGLGEYFVFTEKNVFACMENWNIWESCICNLLLSG